MIQNCYIRMHLEMMCKFFVDVILASTFCSIFSNIFQIELKKFELMNWNPASPKAISEDLLTCHLEYDRLLERLVEQNEEMNALIVENHLLDMELERVFGR